MRKASIYVKIFSIVTIFVVGFAVYIGVVDRTTKDRLEDSDYRHVVAMKDVIADTLPPPLYLVEAYVVAFEISREKNKSDMRRLREHWKQLQSEHTRRLTYWKEHPELLGQGGLRTELLDKGADTGKRLFAIGDEELFPAVEKGNVEAVEAALVALHDAHVEHRTAIERVVALADKQVRDEITAAANAVSSRKLWLLLLGVGIAVIGAIGAALIGRDIARRASALAQMLSKVGEGDLTPRVLVDSQDELGKMALALNQALDSIENAFIDVRAVALELADAAPQLAASSDQISSGAQQQAASLEETAASLEEITAAVKQSAGNAEQASALAMGSRDVAEKGGIVVADAVRAMGEITTSSRRIGDIITTIDEVALQTNLLALNAAVEAARAGEMGRGFAVVAAEVGNLAQRSAAAAKEVKTLIQDSLQRVEAGHRLVDESGRSLGEIIQSVKKVTDIVGEIASASREQSVGVDQVNQAVSQMDQVTQSNAAQTRDLTRTADGLASSAHRLRALVEGFYLSEQSPLRPARATRGNSAGNGQGGGRGRRRPQVDNDNDQDDAVPATVGRPRLPAADFEVA